MKQNYTISSLAPKILTEEKDIKNIKPYLDSLKKTIDADDITNIALTGGYGSGKSTIIKTFQYQNPNYNYLNISLASFNSVVDKEEKSKDDLERLLEVSILQQIFYHVKPSTIPDSRFKRITNITNHKIWSSSIILIMWLICALLLFKFDYINKISPSSWVGTKSSFDWITLVTIIIFFIGIGLFAKLIMRTFSNSKISKLTIQGEMELGENIDKSVFNEHLEEIIYFFERTNYDVVIIEDLDRFNNTDIFIKLREINILLNNSIPISEKRNGRKINFVYAIKDEMFTDKNERVKFFEYIIPVIPFINPSNAGEQLTRLIIEAGVVDVLSKNFTEDVVTFIDDIDMRLLINIFHEYQLYRQNLSEDLNQDNLFAIITYKNLFPDDFGDLHKRKGNLYKFISNKALYIDSLIKKIDQDIHNHNTEIKNIDKQNVESIDDLRRLYVHAILKKIPKAAALHQEGEVSFIDLIKDEHFEKLLEETNIIYYWYQPTYSGSSQYIYTTQASRISFLDIDDAVDNDYTYDERAEIINDSKENKLNKIKHDIQKLLNRKSEIEAWTLKQVFEEIDINPFLENFSQNFLMRSLLINGYINENYNDYISLFHEVNLTKEDYAFERRVKSGILSPFDYKLKKLENLVKKLPEHYFSRDNILNFDLINFLSENEEYCKYYNLVINVLCNEKKSSIDFIDLYIERNEPNIAILIKSLVNKWDGFWDYIYLKSNYTDDKIKNYLILIIKYGSIEDIVLFKGRNMSVYVMQQPDFLSFIDESKYSEKVKLLLSTLNIEFESINPPIDATKDLFNFVYENHLYQINIDNTKTMLLAYNEDINPDNIDKQNYTTILNSGCEFLIEYINKNIDEYVKNVILKLPLNKIESEETLIKLFNNEFLKDNNKIELIKKQLNKIQDLNLIESNVIRKALIEHERILPVWENIFTYYDTLADKKLDNAIIDFLDSEDSNKELSAKKLNENNNRPDQYIKDISIELIYCNDLSLECYINIMLSIPDNLRSWTKLKFENLDFDKVQWLVESKYIGLTSTEFEKLKEHFPNLHITFLIKHQYLFLIKYSDFKLTENDIILLLQSADFTKTNKIKIIEKLDKEVIYRSKRIGSLICDLLIASDPISLEYDMIEYIFRQGNSIEKRIKLLNLYYDQITNSQIKDIVALLDGKYSEIFKKQYKPTFTNTSYHKELFEILDTKGLIIRYEEDKKDSNKLKVYAKYQ